VRRVWILAITAAVTLALATPARADNFGAIYQEPTSVSFQDDRYLSYQFDSNLSAHMRSASDWTLVHSYNTTDLVVSKFADGHRNDLNNHYAIGAMPSPGLIGYHDCVYWKSLSRTRCTHGHIRYENAGLSTTTYERALACHETGHSVGLRHKGTTANSQSIVRCVWTPVPTNDPYLGAHNVAHINGLY
jgi:hypothetical protein